MQAEILTNYIAPQIALMTDDPLEILRFAADSFDNGQGSALVTLVEIRGGASRALGSQMAVSGNGGFCGYVSGGCTEAAVASEAVEAIRKGTDRFLQLGEGSRFFDIVLPCGGGIVLAIHVLRESAVTRNVVARLESRQRVSIGYDPGKQTLSTIDRGGKTGWEGDRFVLALRPLPRVLLCGRSIELDTTATVSRAVGYLTACHDARGGRTLDPARIDADTAVVMLYHDLDLELPVLRIALGQTPFYIGALGSKRTHERRTDALKACGFGDVDIARIKAPIGVFGKARDARSLALSVLGDVAAAYGR